MSDPSPGSPFRVLLVDDNEDHRYLARRALARLGEAWEVRLETAADGEAALRALEGPLPDLVLLDIKMPRLDGFTILRALRGASRTAGLPVVMLSSSENRHDVAQAEAAGANAYLTKPMDPSEFARALQEIVRAFARRSGRA